MRRSTKFAALLTAGILSFAVTACGDDDGGSGNDTPDGGDAPSSDIKVGMAYDVGGRGDQSFNDSAAAGLDQAVEEFGMETEESEAEDGEAETAREERLRTFADAGYDPIIAVGFAYAASVGKVAEEYPDVHFAIIDDSSLADVPERRQPGLRRGAGLVPGRRGSRAEDRDRQRRLHRRRRDPADPEVRGRLHRRRRGREPRHQGATSTYLTQIPDFSGFADPAKGKTAAQGMYDNGADIVYHAAGGSGGGVFEAACGGRRLGHRRRLRPVQHRGPVGAGRHHDLDAQERERRGLRVPHRRSSTATRSRPA